jgi:hypothetical protein
MGERFQRTADMMDESVFKVFPVSSFERQLMVMHQHMEH